MIGNIYKIVHNELDIVYVGSTIRTLSERWYSHKWAYKNGSTISIYSFFKEHNIENFKIILIKKYEVVDNEHLHALETLWINKLKSVNKNMPFQINWLYKKDYGKIYRTNNKEKLALYRELNKEKITEYQEDYRANNREKFIELNKDYRANNKVKLADYSKEYRELNKEK